MDGVVESRPGVGQK